MNAYTLCRLEKTIFDPPGVLVDITWIPSEFAHIGRFLKIEDENGWLVMAAYSTRCWSDLKKHERDSCKGSVSNG